MATIALNIQQVQSRIAQACAAAQRDVSGVRLLAGRQVARVAVTASAAELECLPADGTRPLRLRAPLLVAADSRFSTTRRQLGIGASSTDFGRTVIAPASS